ncbi:unnamed protein product [Closterium sp. NIES-64]|nr:unnamed protein product [Closterium sp. NIES-64]
MAEFNMSACVAACASLQPCLDTCYVYNGWLAPPSLSQTIAFSVAGGAGVGVAALVACVMASTLALDLPSLQALAASADKAERRKARAVLRVRRHGNLLLAALLLASCLASTLAAAAFTEVLGVWWGWLCAFSLLFLAVELLPPALCTNRSLQVAGATAWVGGVAVVALFPLAWPVGLLLDCLVSRSALSPADDDGPVKCRLAPDPLQQGEQEQEQEQEQESEGEGDACKPFAARAGKGDCEEEWSGGVQAWGAGTRGGGQQGEGGVALYGGSVMESGGGEGSSEGAAVQMAVLPSSSHAAMPPPPPLSHAHATQHVASSHPTLASNPLPNTCHTPPAGSPHAAQSPPAPPPWFLQSWEHAAVWARLAAVPPTPAAPTSHPHPADAARALDPPDSSVRAGSGGGESARCSSGVPPLPLSSSTPLWRHRPPLPAAAASSSGQPMPPTDSSASADALRPPH